MQSVILIGGDRRTLYLDRYFQERNFNTYCFGVYAPLDFEALKNTLQTQYVPLILPLPVSKDGESVSCPLVGESLPFDVLLQFAAEHTVYGGLISEKFTELCPRKGIRTVDYYDEDVILKNATLTAVGTMEVLREYGVDLGEKPNIAVTGFGRVARAIAHELLSVGVVPTVAARSIEARFEAGKIGCKVISLYDLRADTSSFDVLLNTVPAPLFSAQELALTKPTVCIVDVASAPFGVDFDAARALGKTAVKAQSLPGKYTPQAAAEVIGEKLLGLISE